MENNKFWENILEMRQRVFGLPTIKDIMDAYKLGIIPIKDRYRCTHSDNPLDKYSFKGSFWLSLGDLKQLVKFEII